MNEVSLSEVGAVKVDENRHELWARWWEQHGIVMLRVALRTVSQGIDVYWKLRIDEPCIHVDS